MFNDYGFDFSNEEVDAFSELAEKAAQSSELGSNDLNDVSGGAAGVTAVKVLGWAWNGAKAIAKTCYNAGKKFADWESSR